MPRKKKTLLDKFELDLAVAERKKLRTAIERKLRDSPPEFFEVAADTPDQKVEFRKWREFYKRVGMAIDSYWEGSKPPDFSTQGEGSKEQKKRSDEYIWTEAFLFLSFYKMVSVNWGIVAPFYREFGDIPANFPRREFYVLDPLKLSEDDLKAMEQQKPPSERAVKSVVKVVHKSLDEIDGPMDATMEFMQYRAVEHINRAFVPEFRQTPYEVRKRLERKKKVRNAKTKEKTKLQMQTDILEETISKRPYRAFDVITLSVIREGARTKVAKASVDDYLNAKSRLDGFIAKAYHKRNKIERSEWKGGFRIKGG